MQKSGVDWTIEREICEIANVSHVSEALLALNVIDSLPVQIRLQTVDDWYRAGAETYLYTFQVITPGREVHLALKACIAYAPGSSLTAILTTWLSRRRVLGEAGVSTPRLFGVGKGVILEEFISHSLGQLLPFQAHADSQLISGLLAYAHVLDSAGFRPIAPFKDLRSRGNDVVAIDFGEDLGPPTASSDRDEPSSIPALLRKYLSANQVMITPSLLARIEGIGAPNS